MNRRLDCAGAAVLIALSLSLAAQAKAAVAVVGKPAPDFHVSALDGQELTLADFKGRVLIINFWATWCAPCKRELPLLDMYLLAQKKSGLAVLAVTTEDSLPVFRLKRIAAYPALPLARRFRGDYPIVGGLPTSYVVDRAGIIRYVKAGAFTLQSLNKILIPLLREQPPPAQPCGS